MERLFCSPLIYHSNISTDANTRFYGFLQRKYSTIFGKPGNYECSHNNFISPKLGIGHTCGSNFTQEYSHYLTILGTPVFSASGCEGKYYRSALLIHRRHEQINSLHDVITSFPKLKIASNYFGSNSGWFLFLSVLAKYCEQHSLPTLSNLSTIIQTGSHNANILSLLTGEADLTSVDCISFALMQRYHPELVKDVKIIGWTEQGITPPFVTSRQHSLETRKEMQRCLLEAMVSMEEDMVKARQEMLLVGIVPNIGDLEDEYFRNINYHKDMAIRYFPHLMERLKPGRLVRQHLHIKRDASDVTVLSKGRLDDEHWPKADFHFQQYLRSFFLAFCYDQISEYFLSKDLRPDAWDVEAVKDAIQDIVGKELWAPLPYGGSTKMILCSWQGVVHLLSLSPPLSKDSRVNDDEDKECQRSLWHVTSSVEDEWKHQIYELIWDLFRREVANTLPTSSSSSTHPSASPSPTPLAGTVPSPQSWEQSSSTVCFSGFMGCASEAVQDYFDSDTADSANASSTTTSSSSPSLMSELWAIDLALSEKLLEVGESMGLYVYISAPRHNDRYDWGNLVIGRNEESIVRWRDSISHSSARKFIAPRSYEHIRIHRGQLKEGLVHPKTVQLHQTTFLEPKAIPSSTTSSSSVASSSKAEKEAYDALFRQHSEGLNEGTSPVLEELNRLFHTKKAVLNAQDSYQGYDPEKTKYYFKRRVQGWSREEVEETIAGSVAAARRDEEELIPNVRGSVKSSFYSDLREMSIV